MTDYQEGRECGGPAFACAGHSPDCGQMFQSGMSLRDWFAGMALQGMLAGLFSDQHQLARINEFAEGAYQYADAMIRQRGKQANDPI